MSNEVEVPANKEDSFAPLTRRPTLVLTGAGFTKDFGGFLASEMWAYIFNSPSVQVSTVLRAKLIDNQDFEGVYSEVLGDPDISAEDKARLSEAVLQAYQLMDRSITRARGAGGAHYDGVMNTIKHILGESSEHGVMFTLNQ